jgi:hypothetical protein
MKTRLLFFALSASVVFASWGAACGRFLGFHEGS